MNVTYDSRNRVVRRVSPTGTLNLTYSGWNLIEERDASGTLEQTYLHGAGIDELLVKITASGPAYYHHDGLGSTVALTGENGELLESYRYDAFGGVTVYDSSGSALPASPRGNRFLFTGREWLGQAGIYDYRNRVFSAQIGRFLQADPIRFEAGDVNIYRYCGNGPVNWRDPDGRDPVPAPGGGFNFVIRPGLNPNNLNGSTITNINPNYSGQCATGAQFLTGTRVGNQIHDAPSTSTWTPGAPVGPNTPIGAMIATGWVNGGYPSRPASSYGPGETINHTGIFQGMNKDGTMNITDQSSGRPIATHPISPHGWNAVTSSQPYDHRPSTSAATPSR